MFQKSRIVPINGASLFVIEEQHHVESPILIVQGERPEITSSGSDSESGASRFAITAPTRWPPVTIGVVPLVASETTVGRHPHLLVTVGTRHVADAMIPSLHRPTSLSQTRRSTT